MWKPLGSLNVSVTEAILNKSPGLFSKASPYYVVTCGDDSKGMSDVHIKGDKSPKWKDNLNLEVMSNCVSFRVTVYFKGGGSFGADSTAGSVQFTLTDFEAPDSHVAQWHVLSTTNNTNTGKILMVAKFIPLEGSIASSSFGASNAVPLSTNESANSAPPSYSNIEQGMIAPPPASAGGVTDIVKASSADDWPTPAPQEVVCAVPIASPVPTSASENTLTGVHPAYLPVHEHTHKTEQQQMKVEKSTVYGPASMNDTIVFEDFPGIIRRIYFFTDGTRLYGLQSVDADNKQNPRHMKNQGEFAYSVLELRHGEHIVGLKGEEDDYGLVCLQVLTNMGVAKHFGGAQNSLMSPFSIHIPKGNVVVGFHGGFGASLHTIGVLSAPGLL